ncbi:carbon-nitrogen hydrolase family protein [Acidithiobacillus sp. AMEEHan]|uniref:carbon-nitrogen hydrolase family protein n=1 Tax=Acidithiobacillus sp. AMEEHan TaxID=2994951 RepID=UPI0027E58F74|nr:carbon-nitrogen hydrolase family protein [Acidithiobacillus sp. AMEEHan]
MAAYQCAPSVTCNKQERVDLIKRVCEKARADAVDILVFPEMFTTGYAIGSEQVRSHAEESDGETAERVFTLASEYRITIVYGYPELDKFGNVYNSANLISPAIGIDTYRKYMLFGDVDRTQFVAGRKIHKPIEINGVKYGLAICYDIEFPELTRALARAGAEIILVPTANMRPYDFVSDILIPARAVENGVFIVYANYYGDDDSFEYFGKSIICDPLGNVLSKSGAGENLLMADADIEQIKETRLMNNYVNDSSVFPEAIAG